MNETNKRNGENQKNTKLNDAIANYFSNTEAINEDTQITAKNTSFFAGGEIEKTYTVKELVAFMSNQPAQVVDSAIAVLSQLTETNDSRYDVAYWTNVANAVLGTENATEETGVTL